MSGFYLRTKDGKELKIERDWMRFGRADDNDIIVRDQAVSRYHLNFYVKEGQLIVEDAGSQNGFVVNGKLAVGAVYLNSGDKLSVGTLDYLIKNSNVPEEVSLSAVKSAQAIAAGVSETFTSDDPSKKRIRIYAIAVVALVLIAVLAKQGDQKPKTAPLAQSDEVDKTLPSSGYRPDTYHTQSITEIQSEAKFRESMRDYDNGNFSRALIGFQESRTLNPEHEEAQKYMEFSEARLEAQLKELQKDANTSMKNLQYRRAKAQCSRILTILSEQIPGYGRKIAQEASGSTDQRRPPGQEETLLKMPCDKTRDAKVCTEALEMINEARRRLGEEDTLR